DWAIAPADSQTRTMGSIKRSDLIGYLLCCHLARGALVLLVSGFTGRSPCVPLTVILNYNSRPRVKLFLEKSSKMCETSATLGNCCRAHNSCHPRERYEQIAGV